MSKISDHFKPLQSMYISLEEIEKIYYNEKKGLNNYRSVGIICDGRNINLSKIMYKEHYQAGRHTMIDPKSYDVQYKIYIDTTLEILFDKKHFRPATINQNARQILYFIEYIKDNDFFCEKDVNEAKKIYQAFTLYLLERSREKINPLRSSTCAAYQKASRLFFSKFCGINSELIEYWSVYISEENNDNNSGFEDKEDRDKSSELVLAALNTYYQLFSAFYDLLVNKRTFPYRMVLPHRSWWIFPINTARYTSNHSNCIDFEHGKVRTFEEAIYKSRNKNISQAKRGATKYVNSTIETILYNNLNTITEERMRFAQTAIESFFMLFLGITGMNEAQAMTLQWGENDEFENNIEVAKFKTIKYRGSSEGKVVEFQIRSGFITEFKKFLELRRFRLNGAQCNYLFFRNAKANRFLYDKFTKGFHAAKISNKFSSRELVTAEMKYVTARDFRNFKSRVLTKRNGSVIAAEALQHTPKTNQSNYNKVSAKEAREQLTSFLDGLHDVIIYSASSDKTEGVHEVASGSCAMPNSPHSISDVPADCSSQGEGCLFCIHYRLHADERDIHKVMSLRYILDKTKQKVESNDHFERELMPYVIRIDFLLDLISEKKNEHKLMVEKIKKKVYKEEILTEWYSLYLNMLYDIGALD